MASEYGSGNVFRDLDLPDADDLHHKSEFLARIGQVMERQGLTPDQAAEITGLPADDHSLATMTQERFYEIEVVALYRAMSALHVREILARHGN